MELPACLNEIDGEIRLTGHRVGLYHVIDCYQDGYSPEMIGEEFPTLSLAQVHRVIVFYLENPQAVDAYVANYRAELDQQEAGHVPSTAAVRTRQRLLARQRLEVPVS